MTPSGQRQLNISCLCVMGRGRRNMFRQIGVGKKRGEERGIKRIASVVKKKKN